MIMRSKMDMLNYDRIVSKSAKEYLIGGKKLDITEVKNPETGYVEYKVYFVAYPDIKFTAEEIKDIDNDEKLNAFVDKKRDMLIGTGYTQVMEPITLDKPVTTEVKPEPAIPEAPVQQVIQTAPTAEPTPEVVEMVKKLTPKEENKSSGVADILIISVIVLVYVAIIVNLILRLK